MDPLTLTAILGLGASLISGFMGSNAAQSAADTEAEAIKYGVDMQGKIAEQARADALPWMEAGRGALQQYLGELGMGDSNFQSQFTETPDYKFMVEQGEKGVMNNLNALGMKNSGAALKKLTEFRTGLANSFRGDYLNRLAGVSGVGQTQTNQTNALAAATGANQAQGIADIGATRASGYVGASNAWTNSLSNFSNNMGSALGRYDQNWQMVGA